MQPGVSPPGLIELPPVSTSWVGLKTALPGIGEPPLSVPVVVRDQLAGATGPVKSIANAELVRPEKTSAVAAKNFFMVFFRG
jgi:hypothetical protein